MEINETIVQSISSAQSERTLGACVNPSLKWDVQFEKMIEKMR